MPLAYERVAILLAVLAGALGKADVYDQVVADTLGAIVIKKSSLYHLISELLQAGYLEIKGSFMLTDKGWRTLHQELNRIERQRLILKQRLHI